FRHHRRVGGRKRSRARIPEQGRATPRLRHHHLRPTQAHALLGPAPRRSALRKNCSIARAEITKAMLDPRSWMGSIGLLGYGLVATALCPVLAPRQSEAATAKRRAFSLSFRCNIVTLLTNHVLCFIACLLKLHPI